MSTEPQRLGKYELRQRLGRGGTAEVWKAYDTQLERYVALKLLHADLQNDPDFMTRFVREAQVIASLHHPNIVRLHDFQISYPPESGSTVAYMVMDYVEGQTLAEYILNTSRLGKFPTAADIVHLFTSISKAIDYAHSKGMIHRDIKPANILLDKRHRAQNSMGEPTLSDFGIAKLMGATTGTLSGMWLGTPLYISPEQAQGHPGNERSDIYSLGVILYEICTGVQPFRGEGIVAIMMQHINAMPTPPALINPNIPPALTMVILRCLAKDPAARFPSASAMTAALAEALNIPVPGELSQPTFPPDAMGGPTHFQPLAPLQPGVSAGMPLPSPSLPLMGSMQPVALTTPQFTGGQGILQTREQASPTTPVNSTPAGSYPGYLVQNQLPGTTVQSPPSIIAPVADKPALGAVNRPLRAQGRWKRRRGRFITLIVLLVLLLVGSSLGALYLFTHTSPAVTANQVVGQAFFVSSGQIFEQNSQGINDELEINLSNISNPAPGKSYYAWLLSDTKQTEWTPLLLTKLTVNSGEVRYFYPADANHTNLLESYSRFLITEEDTNPPPSSASPDQSTWRYYAELPQIPDPKDTVNHYSMLDHLRHLLSNDPTLDKLGLPGGLDIWLYRNTEKILEWAGSARDSWEKQDTALIHGQVVRILDYLDGSTYVYVQQDVPPGTPLLVNPKIAPVPLLEVNHPNQSPPGYLYHINKHLKAIIDAPGATDVQRKLAAQIDIALNNVKGWLEQVHTDAVQLVKMDNTQMLSQAALSMLDNMASQANDAYVGHIDPNTNTIQEGAVQINHNIQLLATFDVTPFK